LNNLTLELELFVMDTSLSCLSKIEITSSNWINSKTYKIGCNYVSGRRKIPISVNGQARELELRLSFSDELYLSEVSWILGDIEVTVEKNVFMVTAVKSDWFSVVAVRLITAKVVLSRT